ncbi:MAG: hypothetical protein ACFB10_25840 [Salibacteraceae bacterium]
MSTYSLNQQVFSLSLMINSQNGNSGDSSDSTSTYEDTLKTDITSWFGDATIQGYLGDSWQISWNPAVYESGQDGANQNLYNLDNALFAAKGSYSFDGTTRNVVVVSVAGTNNTSGFDIVTEDGEVGEKVGLFGAEQREDDTPMIALGNSVALNILTDLTSDAPLLGQTDLLLQNYLAQEADSDTYLIFTGHSLGASLASILAVYLFGSDNPKLSKSDWKDVYVFPTAPPSFGDANFVAAHEALFPLIQNGNSSGTSDDDSAWNGRYVNTLDIVPMAWADNASNDYSNIYASLGIVPTCCLQKVINAAFDGVDGYAAIPEIYTFEGDFEQPFCVAPTKAEKPDNDYLQQVMHQHVDVYVEQLQVTGVAGIVLKDYDPSQDKIDFCARTAVTLGILYKETDCNPADC